MARMRLVGVVGLLGVGLAVAGCGSTSSSSSSAASKPAASVSPAPASAGGAAIATAKGSSGTYLASGSGRALYLWVADGPSRSSCAGNCAKAWPPLLSHGKPVASGGVQAGELGTITRSDGTKQVTYRGQPLYFFVGDRGPGMVNGQGSNQFGAKWWLVAPSGSAITAGTQSSSKYSSGGGSSSSGGGGASSGGGWG
jgi:predicted lipoprotein with Yx(FWY)xxD motif